MEGKSNCCALFTKGKKFVTSQEIVQSLVEGCKKYPHVTYAEVLSELRDMELTTHWEEGAPFSWTYPMVREAMEKIAVDHRELIIPEKIPVHNFRTYLFASNWKLESEEEKTETYRHHKHDLRRIWIHSEFDAERRYIFLKRLAEFEERSIDKILTDIKRMGFGIWKKQKGSYPQKS